MRMSFPRAGGRAVLALSASILGLSASEAHAQCDPDFGQQLKAWVEQEVESQSKRLADSDYRGRTFNYFILAGQDLDVRLEATTQHLDRIVKAIEDEEQRMAADPTRQAMARDRSATRILNELYAARTAIDEIQRRHRAMLAEPSLAAFEAQGLQNVGRATLLASLQELGDARQRTLNGRYGVYLQVTMNENGEVEDAEVNPASGDMVDSIVIAGALQFGGPYAPLIIAVYKIGRFVVEGELCKRKIEEQQELWNAAVALLPEKLISPQKQFTSYKFYWNANQEQFRPYIDELSEAAAQLDARWREIVAYNAARQKAAGAVLTAANVEALRQEHERGGNVGAIFNNMALSETASGIAKMNDFLATGQARLLRSCGNLEGYLAAEDQRDALAYASAGFDVYAKRPEFAPLHPVATRSLSAISNAEAEAAQIQTALRNRACAESSLSEPGTALQDTADEAMANSFTLADVNQVDLVGSVDAPTDEAPAAALALAAAPDTNDQPAQNFRLCILIANGAQYACRAPGSPGQPYHEQFGSGDPGSSVLGGAHDGGYAVDNRVVADEIRRVSANVESRISELDQRIWAAEVALPQWIATNQAFVAEQELQNRDGAMRVSVSRELFSNVHAASVAEARAAIEQFAALPTDATRTEELVRGVGATALTLPELRSDAVVPGAPPLPGITATARVYGQERMLLAQAILRERLKGASLAANSQAQLAARDALNAAGQFQGAGERYARDLIMDAAAIRLMATGQRDSVELAILHPDGRVTRERVSDLSDLPPESLLARVRAFAAHQSAFETRAGALGDVLGGGGGTPSQGRALSVAQLIEDAAAQLYSLGDLLDGERIMRYATLVLDVAVSVTPVVGWGRDVYEAVTGRDMFSDERLDEIGYAAAVFGAITVGVGDDIYDWTRAAKKIVAAGRDPSVAEKIARGAERISVATVDEGAHVMDRARFRAVTNDEWNGLLETGTRFFDRSGGNVAVAMPSRYIGPGDDGITRTYETVVAIVDPLNERNGMMKAVTVFREQAADLGKVTMGEGAEAQRRYIPLGKAPD